MSRDDIAFLKEVYVNFEQDLQDAARYFNADTGLVPRELRSKIGKYVGAVPVDEEHRALTGHIAGSLSTDGMGELGDVVVRAAGLRKFLG